MSKKAIKREIVGIDEVDCCATIAYGYTDRKQAARAIARVTEDEFDSIYPYLEKKRVMKQVRDGQDWWSWGKTCIHCGQKNNGAISWILQG